LQHKYFNRHDFASLNGDGRWKFPLRNMIAPNSQNTRDGVTSRPTGLSDGAALDAGFSVIIANRRYTPSKYAPQLGQHPVSNKLKHNSDVSGVTVVAKTPIVFAAHPEAAVSFQAHLANHVRVNAEGQAAHQDTEFGDESVAPWFVRDMDVDVSLILVAGDDSVTTDCPRAPVTNYEPHSDVGRCVALVPFSWFGAFSPMNVTAVINIRSLSNPTVSVNNTVSSVFQLAPSGSAISLTDMLTSAPQQTQMHPAVSSSLLLMQFPETPIPEASSLDIYAGVTVSTLPSNAGSAAAAATMTVCYDSTLVSFLGVTPTSPTVAVAMTVGNVSTAVATQGQQCVSVSADTDVPAGDVAAVETTGLFTAQFVMLPTAMDPGAPDSCDTTSMTLHTLTAVPGCAANTRVYSNLFTVSHATVLFDGIAVATFPPVLRDITGSSSTSTGATVVVKRPCLVGVAAYTPQRELINLAMVESGYESDPESSMPFVPTAVTSQVYLLGFMEEVHLPGTTATATATPDVDLTADAHCALSTTQASDMAVASDIVSVDASACTVQVSDQHSAGGYAIAISAQYTDSNPTATSVPRCGQTPLTPAEMDAHAHNAGVLYNVWFAARIRVNVRDPLLNRIV